MHADWIGEGGVTPSPSPIFSVILGESLAESHLDALVTKSGATQQIQLPQQSWAPHGRHPHATQLSDVLPTVTMTKLGAKQ